MRIWLKDQGVLLLAIPFLLLLAGLTLLAGLVRWETGGVVLLALASLAGGAGLAWALFRWARTTAGDARRQEEELRQAREQVFRLTQDLRRETDALETGRNRAEFLGQSFAELASSLDPRRVLSGILQRAIHAVHAEHGSILLLDEQGRSREAFFSRADTSGEIGPHTEEVLSKGLARWVMDNRRGDVLFDTAQDARWLSFPSDEKPARSAVAVPFVRRERVLGVMILTHAIPFQFAERHMALLEELAQQAAICLENADLYTVAETERRKLAAILDGTTDAILVVDPRGQVLLLNRAAGRAFGVTTEEALGRPLAAGIPHEPLAALFARALQESTAVNGELTTADERVRFTSLSPVPGVGWVAILQDITYLKELDRMKSDFVSTVSHDLRSPLTTIRGFVDIVPLQGPLTAEQRDAVERIRRAVGQMNELIGDLLDLGKIEAGIDIEMTPCQVDQIAAETVDSLQLTAETKGLDLRSEVTAGLPAVLGNAARLRQVVANLLGNAIKYTPAGGQIRVRLYQHDREVILAVSDTGIGIAPQDQTQLFQKFYRVPTETDKTPGTGLGLAIVRSIVELHGGRVWVQSALGQGSTFACALPALAQS